MPVARPPSEHKDKDPTIIVILLAVLVAIILIFFLRRCRKEKKVVDLETGENLVERAKIDAFTEEFENA